ncbi:MAG: ParB/RepB/Spo0J family partition protein [Candidatus Omnitrophica bacterium]|nr:ParB/RepB/Spo0J family partition protein [Candidatus Omnitrophota bacterium]
MKKALGKGLSALIPSHYQDSSKEEILPGAGHLDRERKNTAFQIITLEQIIPNKDQPRQNFTLEGIEELAASIKEKGILQPIVVKKSGEDGRYMIVCGERRYRAAKAIGLAQIPVIIKDIADENLLEWALVENIQREDLNPLEEAEAYRRLVEERMLSQDEVAKRVGKYRTTVTNAIRLLRLPEEVKELLKNGFLTAGHARTLLGLLTPEHQRQMAKRIVEENLSVRQVELIVNRSNAHKRKAKQARHLKPEIVDLERKLQETLGTQVKIYPRKNQQEGRLEIQYFSLDDLDRILEKLGIKGL